MSDSLLERLKEIAIGIAELFNVEDDAEDLIDEVIEIIDEAGGISGGWKMPEQQDLDSKQLLSALYRVLGKDHPVMAVMQYQESSAHAIRIESTLGDELWKAAAKKYPPKLLQAMQSGRPFTPESLGAPPKKSKIQAPIPPGPWLSSVFTNVVFLSFCDAAIGDRDAFQEREPLLRLVVQEGIFPIGFTNGGRIVVVPVQD